MPVGWRPETMLILILPVLFAVSGTAAAQEPPREWIDPDTGHRVVRLSDEPGSGSLYFNQNGYTADGRKLIYTSPNGIHALDLGSRTSKLVAAGRVRVIEAGRKTMNVYYVKEGAVFATNVDTGETRQIGKLPPRGSTPTVNADETLLAGTYIEGEGLDYNQQRPQQTPGAQPRPLEEPVGKGEMMERRLAARLPMAMFTMSIQTGEVKVIHRATDWLNHLLFSPTDPKLLMFCHEGPWHKVDRIWTIRTDTGKITKIHTRTMAMEIFGHEFWSADGKLIWYDLQTPRGEVFWLASYNVETGERRWYSLQRDEWSIHFNVPRDGSMIAGDGGDHAQVAKAKDGQWIYLFKPELLPNRGTDDPTFIKPGILRSQRLVNMAKHNYRLEPNVSFTPDQKWIVFRSNMLGQSYVFAVQVDRVGQK